MGITPEVMLREIQRRLRAKGVTVTELIIGNEEDTVPYIGVVITIPDGSSFSACTKWSDDLENYDLVEVLVKRVINYIEENE